MIVDGSGELRLLPRDNTLDFKSVPTSVFGRVKRPPKWALLAFPPLWSHLRQREFPGGGSEARLGVTCGTNTLTPTFAAFPGFWADERCVVAPFWGPVNGSWWIYWSGGDVDGWCARVKRSQADRVHAESPTLTRPSSTGNPGSVEGVEATGGSLAFVSNGRFVMLLSSLPH